MVLSGWITQIIIAYIALSLLGLFGYDVKDFLPVYGAVLLALVIWYVARRAGIIPAI